MESQSTYSLVSGFFCLTFCLQDFFKFSIQFLPFIQLQCPLIVWIHSNTSEKHRFSFKNHSKLKLIWLIGISWCSLSQPLVPQDVAEWGLGISAVGLQLRLLCGEDGAEERVGRWHLTKGNAQTVSSQGTQKPQHSTSVWHWIRCRMTQGYFKANACLSSW